MCAQRLTAVWVDWKYGQHYFSAHSEFMTSKGVGSCLSYQKENVESVLEKGRWGVRECRERDVLFVGTIGVYGVKRLVFIREARLNLRQNWIGFIALDLDLEPKGVSESAFFRLVLRR